MQPNYIVADELSEDVTVALRKRAEIDSKHLVVLVEHDETEWNRSLSKFVTFFLVLLFVDQLQPFFVYANFLGGVHDNCCNILYL